MVTDDVYRYTHARRIPFSSSSSHRHLSTMVTFLMSDLLLHRMGSLLALDFLSYLSFGSQALLLLERMGSSTSSDPFFGVVVLFSNKKSLGLVYLLCKMYPGTRVPGYPGTWVPGYPGTRPGSGLGTQQGGFKK